MYTITSNLKEILLSPSRIFSAKLVVGKTELGAEDISDFTVDSSIGNSGQFTIGSTVSKKMTLNLIKSDTTPTVWTNQPVTLYIGVCNDSSKTASSTDISYDWIPLGVFYPEPKSIKQTDFSISLDCYDRMTFLENFQYKSALTYPVSIYYMLNEMASAANIAFTDVTQVPNIQWKVKPEGKTIRQMLSDIAELAAANCVINRTGKFDFIRPSSVSNFALNADNYSSFTIESDDLCKITKLVVTKKDTQAAGNDSNIEYGDYTGSTLTFENDNIETEAELKELYDRQFPYYYYGYTLDAQGMPHLDCGDKIQLTTVKNAVYELPVISHTLKYNGGLTSTFSASVAEESSSAGSSGTGSLTQAVNTLELNTIKTQKMLTDSLEANAAKFNSIEAGKADINFANIANGTIKTAMIGDGQITTAKIEDGQITNAKIGSLDAGKITSGYISADRLEGGVITADKIQANAIKAHSGIIDIGAIGTTQIADGSITDAKIVDLTANKITAGTLDAANIDVVNLDCANLTVGTINGTQIGSGEIDLGHLSSGAITGVADTVHVGGRNLIKNSSVIMNNANYELARYYFGDSIPVSGETYTISAKFTLGSDRKQLSIYTSGGEYPVATLTEGEKNSQGIATKTFTMGYYKDKAPSNGFNFIGIYQMTNTGTSASTLEWVKLERGNKVTDWTPAPEDVEASYTEVAQSKAAEAKTYADQQVSNLQVGGRNYVLNSNQFVTSKTSLLFNIVNNGNDLCGKTVTVSVYVKLTNVTGGTRAGFETTLHFSDDSTIHIGAWKDVSIGESFDGVVSFTTDVPNKTVTALDNHAIYIQCTANQIMVGRPKIETGTKVTDWTPAPEDVDVNINNAISNIQIGGRNLLRNGDVLSCTGTDFPSHTKLSPNRVDCIAAGTFNGYVWLNSNIPSLSAILQDVGAEYTFSADVQVHLQNPELYMAVSWDIRTPEYYVAAAHVADTAGKWVRVSATLVVPKGQSASIFGVISQDKNHAAASGAPGDYILYKNIQIEKGNKATDWTPAPEDVSANITNAISNIQIGGRNFLLGTISEKTVTRNYYFNIASGLPSGQYVYSFWLKSNRDTTGNVYLNDDSGQDRVSWHSKAINLTTEYQKFIIPMNITHTDGVSTNYIVMRVYAQDGDILTGKLSKLEQGNKPTDWSPAPEDFTNAITTAQTTANGKNTVFYSNTQPIAKAKNDVWFDSAHHYKMYIWSGTAWDASQFGTEAIANGAINTDKISTLDAGKITTGLLSADRIESGSLKIEKLNDSAKNDISNGIWMAKTSSAKMIYPDPTFTISVSGVNLYNNAANGLVTVSRVTSPSDCPTTSGYCMRIVHTGAGAPGYGGFYQVLQSRANAVFIVKYLIKLPVGYSLNTASNSMGTGFKDTWLTSTAGTGSWAEYIRKVDCGSTGTFSNGGHVYVTGSPAPTTSAPLTWYLGSIYTYDLTDTSNISGWCSNSDTTCIDGGKIYAGSINTKQLAADAVTARCIAANSIDATCIAGECITGDLIHGASITGDKIVGKSITADQIQGKTITANEIFDNTITSNKIDVKNLAADKVFTQNLVASSAFIDSFQARTATLDGIDGCVDINNGVITLGSKTNQMLLQIRNNEIAFTQNGNCDDLGVFTSDALKADNVIANDTLKIGGFKFMTRTNGNVSLIKV